MKTLPPGEYKKYMDSVSLERTLDSGNSQQMAENMFAQMFELRDGDLNLASMTEEQFQASSVKAALDSLFVEHERMFNENELTTLANCRQRIGQAMDRIAPAMVNPESVNVPYTRDRDGKCSAIVP